MQKKLPSPLVSYETYLTVEKIGTYPLHLEALKDLDKSLDEICTLYAPATPEEEQRLLDLCPYFGIIWPSARALGIFMTERKSQFIKKRGIEVGCGLALPSVVGAKIGAQMVATDFHPDVGAWVKRNADLNQVKIEYHEWDWTKPMDTIAAGEDKIVSQGENKKYDFVLASDVLYEKQHPEDLATALANLVVPDGSIYLSDPGRAYLNRALEKLEELGFHSAEFEYAVEESSSRPEIRLEKKRTIKVFEFSRRQ